MNFSDLKNDLSNYPENRIVFVGLGNRWRQDDSAGLVLTEKINNSKFFCKATFILAETTPENYLNQILESNPKLVVFIDAADMGAKTGAISWIEEDKIEELGISTHTYSISLIEKYLKLNNKLDVRYLVIQPEYMDYGESPSEQLDKKINQFFN